MSANILKRIIAHKVAEVEQNKKEHPLAEIKDWAEERGPSRKFAQSLDNAVDRHGTAIIAEIKKASPSKGTLAKKFDPLQLARAYAAGGAACVSVVTDREFFQGSGVMLDLVRRHCLLPMLRKDFIIDAYQIYESRAYGADCILLIASVLASEQLLALFQFASEQDIDVLVEVHNEEELERALALGERLQLLGINNRNLDDFSVDIGTTPRIAAMIPSDKRERMTVVSESGIARRADIERLAQAGVHTVLVGELLVTADDPQSQLQQLLVTA